MEKMRSIPDARIHDDTHTASNEIIIDERYAGADDGVTILNTGEWIV